MKFRVYISLFYIHYLSFVITEFLENYVKFKYIWIEYQSNNFNEIIDY